MYLWFSFAMFLLGGFFAMVIRAELFQPGMQLVEPGFFNQMTTLHGLVMVFAHRLFPLTVLHAGDVTRLDDIARVIAECVALVG